MAAPNWANQTIWTADNLDVLRGMNSASVDLVYLDPPFNSNKDYGAPIGSEAAGAAFKDAWTLSDLDEAWHNEIADPHPVLYKAIEASVLTHGESMQSYLIMMALRLRELRRVLKETGSIYLHCDPTASHYLKVLMDAIFGPDQFRNEIAWCYPPTGRPPKQGFPRKHDIILFYARSETNIWSQPYTEMTEATRATYSSVDEDGRRYSKAHGKRTYLDEVKGRAVPSWWDDIGAGSHMPHKERMGYPTQKPLALVERIIGASSNPGDVVLDPFCGCATACVAAEKLNRQWVGIDISAKAAELVALRMQRLYDRPLLPFAIDHREDLPRRTDLGPAPPLRESRVKLYGEQGGDCMGCGTHFAPQHLTIDHIIPVTRGGTDHLENLQLLCGHCNAVKGDRPMEYLRTRLARSAA